MFSKVGMAKRISDPEVYYTVWHDTGLVERGATEAGQLDSCRRRRKEWEAGGQWTDQFRLCKCRDKR